MLLPISYRGFSGSSTYTKLRRTLEKASDYGLVQVHDGFPGFSKHDTPEAKRKKQSVFFSDTKLEVPNGTAFQLHIIVSEGGPIASSAFMWKMPLLESERNTQQHLSMVAQCQATLRDFKSRREVYDIQATFSSLVKMQPAISRSIMSQLGVSIAS